MCSTASSIREFVMSANTAASAIVKPIKVQSLRARGLHHVRKYPSFWVGLLILAVFLLLVVAAPLVATHGPMTQDMPKRLSPPSAEHLFGTDELGRDIFSRTIYGAQISLPMALVVVAVSLVGG